MSEEQVQAATGEELGQQIDIEDMIKEALAEAKAEPVEKVEEKPAVKEKPKGSDFIEDFGDKEIVKERLNYLYKQGKASDETNHVIRAEYGKVTKALEEANKRLSMIEQRKAQEEDDKALRELKGKIREARDLGEDDKAEDLNELLLDYKTEQKVRKIASEQRQETKQEQPIFNKGEFAYAERLRDEKDEEGNLLRPWMLKNDKEFDVALTRAAEITKKFSESGEPFSIKDVFKELDGEFLRKKEEAPATKPAQQVLSGKTTITPPKTVALSDRERVAAKKLNISEQQYAKSKQLAEKYTRVSIEDF